MITRLLWMVAFFCLAVPVTIVTLITWALTGNIVVTVVIGFFGFAFVIFVLGEAKHVGKGNK